MLPSRGQTSVPSVFFRPLLLPLPDPEEDIVYLRSPTVVVDSFAPHRSTRAFSRYRGAAMQEAADAEEKHELEFQSGFEGARKGRAGSRRKTRLPRGVTLEWQLEGLMIPSRESFPRRRLPRSRGGLRRRCRFGIWSAARKSSRLDRASGVASAFINQRSVRLTSTRRHDVFLDVFLPECRVVRQACNVVNAFGGSIIRVAGWLLIVWVAAVTPVESRN